MVQPYNYSLNIRSPGEAFMQGIQMGQAARLMQEQQAEIEQKKLERQRADQQAQQMQSDLQDYTTAPTPQKLANLYLRYPAMKESLNAYSQTLSDADKKTTTEFATQAFGLNRSGKTEDLMGLFDRYIAASENSRPELTRIFKDAKDTISKIDDPAAREALIGSVLANTGKEGLDLYDKVYKQPTPEDTPFIKELLAEGLERGSAEFQQALEDKRNRDAFIAVPGVGLFDRDKVNAAAKKGATTISPQIPQAMIDMLRKNPETKGQFDERYGTPENPNPSNRILGGQTGKPSGTFQGQ